MMAVHWYPERRHRLEDALLRCYHQALIDAGVPGYGFDALRHDYRLAVVRPAQGPGVPALRQAAGGDLVEPPRARIFLAFDDLGCEELLRA